MYGFMNIRSENDIDSELIARLYSINYFYQYNKPPISHHVYWIFENGLILEYPRRQINDIGLYKS